MKLYAMDEGERCTCCDREATPWRPLILTDKGYVCAHDDFCRAGTTALSPFLSSGEPE